MTTRPTHEQAPRWRRLDHDERRAQILDAARRLYSERGYPNVSMADIAAEAGVTRGLLNHYFGTKAGLYLEIVREASERTAATVRTDRELPREDAMAANFDAMLDAIELYPDTALARAGVGGFELEADQQVIVDAAREAIVDRMLVNNFGTTEVSRPVRLALQAYVGFVESALRQWRSDERVPRTLVHALLMRTLTAVLDDVVPALEGSAAER